jgi:uncharacterized protein (DUF4415 family)
MQKKSGAGENGLIDPDDAPELDAAFFNEADHYRAGKLISRGGRPRSPAPKIPVSLRLDPDVVSDLRAMGAGWQSRVNQVLKDWLRHRS